MKIKNNFYIISCISFIIIIGAGVYEHLVVWPNAYAALPRSLAMFQGEYKVNSAPFWMPIHPVTLVLLIISLVLHFKTERKRFVMIPLIIYAVVLATTFIYFVPELLSLINTPYADTVSESLTSRASTWEMLSIVRLAILVFAAFFLLTGLMKPSERLVQPYR